MPGYSYEDADRAEKARLTLDLQHRMETLKSMRSRVAAAYLEDLAQIDEDIEATWAEMKRNCDA